LGTVILRNLRLLGKAVGSFTEDLKKGSMREVEIPIDRDERGVRLSQMMEAERLAFGKQMHDTVL
jgi:hypothetical protein